MGVAALRARPFNRRLIGIPAQQQFKDHMMERSVDEIKKINVSAMGDTVGVIYSELWQEVGRLFSEWKEYVALFGTNTERIDLLNSAAGHFFRIVQDSLWDRTLLNIARIIDPIKTCGRKNLSLDSLANTIADSDLKHVVEASISNAKEKCAFVKDWRNRHIVHADFELVVDANAEPLAMASRQQVSQALISIQDVLNSVSEPLLDTNTQFDELGMLNSAEDLIHLIDFALRKKDEQHKRIESGSYTEDDLAELRSRSV